jgi:hypothetical protein
MVVTILLVFDGAILVMCVLLLFQKRADRMVLCSFIRSTYPLPDTDRERVFHLARKVFMLPAKADPIPWPGLFKTLGARASAVIQSGGCCAGKGRLLILLLAELDIHAYQIGLYHRNGQAQHCLVEVCLKSERLIVDPTYGIYYETTKGEPITLRELQGGIIPRHVPLLQDRICGYPNNSYYDFCYKASKTLNWTKSLARRVAYRVLNTTGLAIDHLVIPASLEWQQHLLIILAVMVAVTLSTGVLGVTYLAGTRYATAEITRLTR